MRIDSGTVIATDGKYRPYIPLCKTITIYFFSVAGCASMPMEEGIQTGATKFGQRLTTVSIASKS